MIRATVGRRYEPRSTASLNAACLLLSLCLAMPAIGAAQELAAERAAVLTAIGEAESVDQPLFPLAPGLGLVLRHEVSRPNALHLRLHFVVRRAAPAWALQIRDEAGELVWSTWDGEATGPSFWSDEIPGKKAVVEVFSTRPANPLELLVDRIAIGTPEITPLAIVGPNQLSPIGQQDPWIRDLGRSVARLRFVADDGRVLVCSAFLVTRDLLFTNQHCIATVTEMESALVDFDYDAADSPAPGLRLRELLESDEELDYSVLRLSAPVARPPLRLSSARTADRERLLVIQHPAGEPKQVSLADCLVRGALVAGRKQTPTDFGHECDTKGGSSGSPVLGLQSRQVVGLHHLGFRTGSSTLVNRAAHIDLVLARLGPALRAEIGAGQ